MSKALEEMDIVNQNVELMQKDIGTVSPAHNGAGWLLNKVNVQWLLRILFRALGAIVLAIHENTQVQHQILKAAEYRNSLLAQPKKD